MSSTPIMRGQRPESEAETGARRKTAFASDCATFGSTVTPSRFFAYCCTSWR